MAITCANIYLPEGFDPPFFIGTAVVTKEEWLLLVQYLCCRSYDALGLMLFALCQL